MVLWEFITLCGLPDILTVAPIGSLYERHKATNFPDMNSPRMGFSGARFFALRRQRLYFSPSRVFWLLLFWGFASPSSSLAARDEALEVCGFVAELGGLHGSDEVSIHRTQDHLLGTATWRNPA